MDKSSTCGKCFGPGACLAQSERLDKREALGLLRALISQGRQPMLCQCADSTFRVCHESAGEFVRARSRSPVGRASR